MAVVADSEDVGRGIAGVAAGFVVVFVSVTGDGFAAAPTNAAWASGANAICAAANAKVRALPAPGTASVLVADAEATYGIAEAVLPRLAALPRPAGEQAAIAALLEKMAREYAQVKRTITALTNGSNATAKRLATQGVKLDDENNAAARKLGANVCAENPSPGGGPVA